MNAPDYDALEAVAAAATKGPWVAVTTGVRSGDHWSVLTRSEDSYGDAVARIPSQDGSNEEQRGRDATHIATFDPSMVADLLARARERDAAIAERDRLMDGIEALIDTSDAADADCGSCSQKSSHARQLRTLLDQTANDGNTT